MPPGGWLAQKDQERVLRAGIHTEWPDREPGLRAFREGGMGLRVTDTEANVWLPQALHAALIHLRYRLRNPPPPQPQPPQKRK